MIWLTACSQIRQCKIASGIAHRLLKYSPNMKIHLGANRSSSTGGLVSIQLILALVLDLVNILSRRPDQPGLGSPSVRALLLKKKKKHRSRRR